MLLTFLTIILKLINNAQNNNNNVQNNNNNVQNNNNIKNDIFASSRPGEEDYSNLTDNEKKNKKTIFRNG